MHPAVSVDGGSKPLLRFRQRGEATIPSIRIKLFLEICFENLSAPLAVELKGEHRMGLMRVVHVERGIVRHLVVSGRKIFHAAPHLAAAGFNCSLVRPKRRSRRPNSAIAAARSALVKSGQSTGVKTNSA